MNEVKEHIITVASKLFLQKSYKEVTMREIVEKTGLSKGGFYHYFVSKEQLFLEVLDFFFNHVMTHAYEDYSRESLCQFYHDYANQMSVSAKSYMERFREGESEEEFNMNYFSLAFDGLKLFPKFREKMVNGLDMELDIWKSLVQEARERGEISAVMSDDDIAQAFVLLGDGLAMHMIASAKSIDEIVGQMLKVWDSFYLQIKSN